MKAIQDYVIRQETMVFLPKYTKFGERFTHVIEQEKEYDVAQPPTELMNECLGYYGASLRGAYDGAKKVLGNMHMCPVLVNGKLGHYWFATRSIGQPNCIWFALHHVKHYESEAKKETKVTLSNGLEITVDISLNSFEGKIRKAYQLKGKLEERFTLDIPTSQEMKMMYRIRERKGIMQYELREDTRKK